MKANSAGKGPMNHHAKLAIEPSKEPPRPKQPKEPCAQCGNEVHGHVSYHTCDGKPLCCGSCHDKYEATHRGDHNRSPNEAVHHAHRPIDMP